jgi:hypothetical protein
MRAGYRGALARADRVGVSICPSVHIGRSNPGAVMYRKLLALTLAVCLLLGSAAIARADSELLVFAAASLTNALDALGPVYTQETDQPVKFSYAASSALARQLEAGASADVFVSADLEWMDYAQSRNLIVPATRRDLLGNHLVLIAPASSQVQLEIKPGFALGKALGGGRLATGDPDRAARARRRHVPRRHTSPDHLSDRGDPGRERRRQPLRRVPPRARRACEVLGARLHRARLIAIATSGSRMLDRLRSARR